MSELFSHQPNQLGIAAALLLVAIAVVFDVRERRIPNRLVGPAMLVGILVNTIAFGPDGILFALTGLIIGGLLFLLPVAVLNRGAGDLKLLAAIGCLCGPSFALWTGLWAGVFGAICALVVLLWTRKAGTVFAGMSMDLATGTFPIARSGLSIPYAIPLALGLVAAILNR